MHHRINILGASGCGASTTARALAKHLSIRCFDSDEFFHGPSEPPFNNPRPAAERYAMITAALADGSWVLGGGVAGWEPYPELGFSLVVFLWLPMEARVARLRERERALFGDRILPGGDMHDQHEAFVVWASGYDRGDVDGKTLARHEAWLAEQTCPVLDIREPQPTTQLVTAIASMVRSSST